MSRLKAIKLRIGSIGNTQQITKAMKMVSASKLKRAQQNIENARGYANSLRSMMHGLYNSAGIKDNQFFQQRSKGKALVIIITSDKGLCGSLNANVIKTIPNFIETELKDKYDSYGFVAFGKKGNDYLRRNKLDIDNSYIELRENMLQKEMIDFVHQSLEDYGQGKINALYVIHSKFVSLIKQASHWSKIIPIEQDRSEEMMPGQYIFEPGQAKILDSLIPLYAENQAMEALFDNIASEHSSRMIAMDAASKNAAELIKKLQLQYNRARQAAITTELIEIISGAEVASS